MRLNELRDIGEIVISEGVIPPHITMTLDQVVTAGKITNPVQKFLMANLVNMFKNGGPNRWPREINSSQANSDIIDAVASLKEEEQEGLAKWFLSALQDVGNYENRPCPYQSPEAPTKDWVKWVTRKQN